MRRIGVLMWGEENDSVPKTFVSAFLQALADLGWTDGRNVQLDLRWSGTDINRIRALARELVGLQPDIIATGGTAVTAAVPGCAKTPSLEQRERHTQGVSRKVATARGASRR